MKLQFKRYTWVIAEKNLCYVYSIYCLLLFLPTSFLYISCYTCKCLIIVIFYYKEDPDLLVAVIPHLTTVTDAIAHWSFCIYPSTDRVNITEVYLIYLPLYKETEARISSEPPQLFDANLSKDGDVNKSENILEVVDGNHSRKAIQETPKDKSLPEYTRQAFKNAFQLSMET